MTNHRRLGTTALSVSPIGLGLAGLGGPAYITPGLSTWLAARDLPDHAVTIGSKWCSTRLAHNVEMKNVVLSLPTFAFIVTTRAALAAGVGLLLSSKLPESRRRAAGATLVALGAVTTIPAVIAVVRSLSRSNRRGQTGTVSRDKRLIDATRFPRKGDDDGI